MQHSQSNNIKADANADTFVSAKWNIQICQSGDIDGSKTIYPFGKKMRKNAILDSWLRSVILLFQQTQSNVETLDGSANMRELTRGYIQLGTGIKPISYSDTQLSSYVRESDYIRPFYGFETGYGIIESGAAIFRRSYDFLPESKNITYTEAGFRPYASALINDGTLKNKIWSRFLFTAETGIVGFLSGYIDNSGVFNMLPHEIDQVSGVFVTGQKHFIGPIKTKKRENIIGFLSGFRDSSGIFSSINEENCSGYFISGQQYYFPTGDLFDNFNNQSGFDPYLGYIYSGFSFQNGSGFSGNQFPTSGSGIMTGFIGNRSVVNFSGAYSGLSGIPTHEYGWYYTDEGFFGSGLPNFTGAFTGGKFDIGLTGFSGTPFGYGEKIIGFISGYVNELNNFIRLDNVNIPNFKGYSGYYIENEQRFFPTGNLLSGFSGQSGFDINLQYRFSGFNFIEGSGFSGDSWPIVQKENVIGFMSGFMTEVQEFIPFQNLYPELSSSGYYISGIQRFFPTGNLFSGFLGQPGIDASAYEYSGFFLSGPSGFSGANFNGSGTGILTGIIGYRKYATYPFSGSGVITGYIGDRNVLKYSNTGILTGLIGYKDYISGIPLEYGQFVRVTYEVMSRIPMLTGSVQVTGSNLVDGSFNASGQLKLIGLYEYIFGYWSMRNNGRHTENPFVEGFWWPSNPVHCFRDWPPGSMTPCPYAKTHLSANLIQSGYGTFPPINQVRSLPAVNFSNDEAQCLTSSSRGPDCSVAPSDYILDIRRRARWSSRGEVPDDGNPKRDSRLPIYPVVGNGLLQETYNQNTKPAFIDIKIIFPAEYPNSDVAINGIFISPSIDECVLCDGSNSCSNQFLKPYSPDPEWIVYPCKPDWNPSQGDYHVWKNENVSNSIKSSYGISGRQGVGWAYLFNTPQMKYEDQKIEVDFRFSMLRDTL
jgi:hypothetical protein